MLISARASQLSSRQQMERSAHRRVVGLIAVAAVFFGVLSPRIGIAEVPSVPLPPVRVEVTGNPAPVETQRLAILTAARALVPEARSGQVSLTETTPPLQPLSVDSEMALRAIVQVTAGSAEPVTRAVPVAIHNAAMPWTDAQALLISNSPETLAFGKVLLNASVASGATVRLLYHHANGSPTRRMTIGVSLSNPAQAPITLWVIGAAGRDGAGELALGHAAARTFLDQYWHHAGFMVQIPANTTLPLFLHDLAPGGIASGLTQFTLLAGDRLNVQVFARLEGEIDPPMMSYAPNFDRVHQRGVFDRPQVVQPQAYTVGDPSVSMNVGDEQDALRESQTGIGLDGNYGVVYTFPIEVSNPRTLPALLGVVMHALSGEASGTVLVDGRIIDIPRLRHHERRLVTTIHLAPGEHRPLVVSTMPESGGYYPVRLTLGAEYK